MNLTKFGFIWKWSTIYRPKCQFNGENDAKPISQPKCIKLVGLSHALLHRTLVWATSRFPLEVPPWFASRRSPARAEMLGILLVICRGFGLDCSEMFGRYIKTYGGFQKWGVPPKWIVYDGKFIGPPYGKTKSLIHNDLSRHPQDEAADTKEQWNPFHGLPEGQVVDQSVESSHESRHHLLEIHVHTSWLLRTPATQRIPKADLLLWNRLSGDCFTH